MRVNGRLVGAGANTLEAGTSGLAAVMAKLVGGLAIDGLAETGVDVGGGGATESLRRSGCVVRGLGGGLLGVAREGVAGRGGAGREDLCAELGDGVVADENTRLVL